MLRDESLLEQEENPLEAVVTEAQDARNAAAPSPAEPEPAPAVEAAPALAPAPAPAPAPQAAEPVPAPAPPVRAAAPTEGMVFPDSGRRLLRPAELAGLGPATLTIARNEIFARNGRRFARAEIRNYFSQFDWYRPVSDNVRLNPIEQQNIALLQRAEARFGQ